MRKRDPNRIEMGRRFREARERLNWSREVLAERADLSVSFIADLELGNTGTRLENFIRLCRLLDLNADYVLFGAPGDAVQRITDLLRDRDEETVRVVERTVEALLRALEENHLEDRFVLITKTGTGEERLVTDFEDLKKYDIPYLSTVIIKKQGRQ